MTPAELDLARRAVACRALRGRAPTEDPRWTGGCTTWRDGHGVLWRYIDDGREWLPDLTDPATLGCLLALAGEQIDPAALVAALEAACQE